MLRSASRAASARSSSFCTAVAERAARFSVTAYGAVQTTS
jgi:hypothetical protein